MMRPPGGSASVDGRLFQSELPDIAGCSGERGFLDAMLPTASRTTGSRQSLPWLFQLVKQASWPPQRRLTGLACGATGPAEMLPDRTTTHRTQGV